MLAKADKVAEASAMAEGETPEDRERLAREQEEGQGVAAAGAREPPLVSDSHSAVNSDAGSIGSDAAIGAGDDEDAADRLAFIGASEDGARAAGGQSMTMQKGLEGLDVTVSRKGQESLDTNGDDSSEEFPPAGVVSAVVAALLDAVAPKPHMSVSVLGQASGALASSIERVVEEMTRQVSAKAALADPGQTIAIDLAACGAGGDVGTRAG